MQRLLILFLVCSCFAVKAQRPFMQDIWLNENRTPLRANVLYQDSRGYLLIGTDQGLYRYNGNSFRLVKGPVKNAVSAIGEHKGELWVGYRNGMLAHTMGDSLIPFRLPGYHSSAGINALRWLKDDLWLATEEGILHFAGDSLTRYNSASGLTDDFVYALGVIDEQRIVAGTDQGINDIRLQKNARPEISALTADNGLLDNIARVIRPTGTPGKYWIGAQQGGLSLYDSRTRQCHRLKMTGGWLWGQVNDILPVTKQRTWVATDDGYLLELILAGPDSVVVNAYACQDKKVNALLLDQTGNIWCATSKGISMVTAEYLNYIALPLPFVLADVTAMCCDRSNRLWLALKNDLYIVDLNDNIKMLRKVFHSRSPVSVLYCSEGTQIWAGTSGDGLWFKPEGSEAFGKVAAAELGRENILSITATPYELWVSGLNGVKEFGRGAGALRLLRTHNKATGIGSDYIYQLFTDSRKQVWMATDGAGVCLYKDGQYFHWKTFDSPANTVAYTLTEDAYGGIWAGTLYKDLFRFNNGSWENIRKKEVQDIDVNLSTVNANATGQVIAVYQRCVDLWYPASGFFRHFNSRHGLGMDSTSRVLNCSAKDTAGNVYTPFEKGLLVFRNQDTAYDIKPVVNIIRVSNNLKNVAPDQHHFGPDENYLSFYFDGISFTNPERLNYRFRLEGYSDNWVYTNDPLATFPKLPPGTFTFRVQASLNGGFEYAGEVTYSFTIEAPLWRKPWFVLLLVLVVVSVAYLLIRYRDRKMQRLALLEQERVIFDYEHLKSQVNPHFLFNSLNTLTNLIEEDPQNAVLYTERLSDLYRNMLTYHNKDLVTLGEEWELLSAYLYIQQSRFGDALQIKGSIEPHLMKERYIPPMALQLLVENAIKHNVVSRSAPLIIEIAASDEELTVKNRINPKIRKELESGIGLANISSRYALLGKRKVYFGREGESWVVKLPLF